MPALKGNTIQDLILDWFKNNFSSGAANTHVKATDNHPTTLSDGGTAAVVASGTLLIGDLTQYGFPYASLTFTEAGGANTATITWSVSQGQFRFQIAGTAPDVDLTGTNTKGTVLTDIPIMTLGALTLTTGQTMGAGQFYLPRV